MVKRSVRLEKYKPGVDRQERKGDVRCRELLHKLGLGKRGQWLVTNSMTGLRKL